MTADDILKNATVITLQKRPERFLAFADRYEAASGAADFRYKYGFDGTRLPIPSGWQTSPGAFGCCLAHVGVWASFLSDLEDDEPLFVMEDDAVFCDGFCEKLEAVAPLVPDDWDVFYLGGERLRGRPAPEPVAETGGLTVMREVNVNRLHAYVVNARALRKIFPRLLAYLTNAPKRSGPSGDETCFDYEFGRMTEEGVLNVYGVSPWLVGQGPFGSDTYPGKGETMKVRFWS